MQYVNVGALYPNGQRIPTKTALKTAAAEGNVAFDQTSAVHYGNLPGIIEPFDLASIARQRKDSEPIELSVVGPDPYNNRRWYAGVKIGKHGKLAVS